MTAQPLADPNEAGEPPGRREHPEPEQLERFLVCEVSAAERRAVVSHLLTGCPQCRYITSRLWKLGRDRKTSSQAGVQRELRRLWQRTPSRLSRQETAVAAIVKAAQEMMLETARDLQALHDRLDNLSATLPPSPQADAVMDDVLTELRCVIHSVLADRFRPAALDLRAAAAYPADPPDEDEAPTSG